MTAAAAAISPLTEAQARAHGHRHVTLLDAASEEEALPAPAPAPDWTREGAWKLDAELPGLNNPKKTVGTVVGFSRDGQFIRVKTDGNHCAATYAPRFWEPISRLPPQRLEKRR